MSIRKNENFKYKVEEIVNTKEGKIKILNQYYKHKPKKYNDKIYEITFKCYDIECQVCHGVIYGYKEDKIDNLVKCPYCSKQRLLVGFNDMWTTHPEQAKLLKYPEDGYKHMYSSNKPQLEWLCPYCKEEIIKTPNDVSTKGLCCPNCKNRTSYPNRFMYHFIKQLTNNIVREKIFEWSENRRYDICFNNECICEAHGLQHYEDQQFFTNRTLEEEQENDRLKEKLAKQNGIKEYIVIDCRYSDFEYIKKNVLHSRFNELYDLSIIDWVKLENDVNNNIFIEAANLWNSGVHDPEVIANKLDIYQNNLHMILGRAKELGLCDYDTKITQAIGREKMNKIKYHKYAKPLLCNESKECFGTVTICETELNNRNLNVDRRNISRNAQTGKLPVRGLTFSYITHEEFNNIKRKSPDKAFGDFFDLELDETNK